MISYLIQRRKKTIYFVFLNIDLFIIVLFYKAPVNIDIPTTRHVYESVLNGLERIGVNYPIGKYIQNK